MSVKLGQIAAMSNTCRYRNYVGEFRNVECGLTVNGTHRYCKFHTSLMERERNQLSTPRWALAIHPIQDHSEYPYESSGILFQDYEVFRNHQKAVEDGELSVDDDDFIGYDRIIEPYPQFIDNLNKWRLTMPNEGCRFIIPHGKNRGFYCCTPNVDGSDFCQFHESTTQWIRNPSRPSRQPHPLWADCILPTVDDSKFRISEFPWRSYDVCNLMFCDIDPRDKDEASWNFDHPNYKWRVNGMIQLPSMPSVL